jgi:hypothetical protein
MDPEKLEVIKKNFKQEQVDFIKEIVIKIFNKIDELEKKRNLLQDDIRVLKHDLYDLKDGRMDKIYERKKMLENQHGVDLTNIIKIDKVQEAGNTTSSPWYTPYTITCENKTFNLNNSIVKLNAPGSYKLADNSIKYL